MSNFNETVSKIAKDYGLFIGRPDWQSGASVDDYLKLRNQAMSEGVSPMKAATHKDNIPPPKPEKNTRQAINHAIATDKPVKQEEQETEPEENLSAAEIFKRIGED